MHVRDMQVDALIIGTWTGDFFLNIGSSTMPQHKILTIDAVRGAEDELTERLRSEDFVTLSCLPDDRVAELVQKQGVAVVLIATGHDERDGLLIARDLRNRTGAGIIILGASGDEVDIALALEMGADDYVTQPVRLRELCARIRTVLRRTIVTPANEHGARPVPDHFLRRIGDMEICGVKRLVRVAGRSVELTELEFDVLMVLAANTNAVLSRDRITRAARGRDWAANDRSIDSIVSRLRKKLFCEATGAQRIRTVKGRGYMLLE